MDAPLPSMARFNPLRIEPSGETQAQGLKHHKGNVRYHDPHICQAKVKTF